MRSIKAHGKAALFHVFIKVKEEAFVVIIFLEKWREDQIPFKQILAGLFGVTVLRSGLFSVGFVYEAGY